MKQEDCKKIIQIENNYNDENYREIGLLKQVGGETSV